MSVPFMTVRSEVNLFFGLTSLGAWNRVLSPAMQSMMSCLFTNIMFDERWANTVLVNAIGSLFERIISMASGEKKIFLFAAADRISSFMSEGMLH